MSRYTFGDSERAAQRLARVARVFEGPSQAFLTEWGLPGCGLAVDLGCGPGFTTELVDVVLAPQRSVGLDASAAFLAEARRRVPRLEFLAHDVCRVPFPTGPADLLHARLLLTHLPEPAEVLRAWTGALRSGGRLLVDEVEAIETEDPVFRRYLALVEVMLEAAGHCLAIGPRMDGLAAGLPVQASQVARHPVDPKDAAELFALNLEGLRRREDVRAREGEAVLEALASQLEGLRARGAAPITWSLRRLVIGG